MTFEALVSALRDLHAAAPKGEKVTAIHQFGIRHSADLSSFAMSDLSRIAEGAGLSPKYGTELRKMVRLSKYVEEKSA